MSELIKTIAEYPFSSLFLAIVIYELIKIIAKCIK